MMTQRSMPPRSVSHIGLNIFALCCGVIALLFMRDHAPKGTQTWEIAFFVYLAVCLPLIITDLVVRKKQYAPSTGLAKLSREQTKKNSNGRLKRVALKLLTLYATFALIAFLYWLFPLYHTDFYQPFFNAAIPLFRLWLMAAPVYFWLVDRKQINPAEDSYLILAEMLLRQRPCDSHVILPHFRDWLVKAFFIPLMTIFLFQNITFFMTVDFSTVTNNFKNFYNFFYPMIFLIDVLFAAVGYVLTMKLLDTHIRSSEPTLLGWGMAIACYPPFWTMLLYSQFFAYDNNHFWGDWLENNTALYAIWGSLILLLVSIYTYATIAFGYRFSNLTYRGIITNGPYRWFRHPAYVTKNLSWWLISAPFLIQNSLAESFQACLLLAGVNAIYYLRARTEEHHLSRYPEYVAYAEWINQHGILSRIGLQRILPFIAYKRPPYAAKETDAEAISIHRPMWGKSSWLYQ